MHLIEADSSKQNNPLKNIKTVSDLCDALNVNRGQLYYIIYDIGVGKRYKTFSIPKKSGGEREIAAPVEGLKLAQSKLYHLFKENISFKPCVKGFVPDEGVVRNAMFHKKSRWILNLDIEDFFGSINFGRVRGVLMSKPFEMPKDVATFIAKICVLDNKLPQGAPTSPIMANIIASMLDNKMLKIAKKYKIKYTRYADDITFSSVSRFPKALADIQEGETVLSDPVVSAFKKSGFTINYSKVRLQRLNNRQEVTGLVVNEKVNVPVEFKKKLRSAIHQWCRDPELAERNFLIKIKGESEAELEVSEGGERLKRNIYGRLAYMAQVKGRNDPTFIRLALKMGRHDKSPPRYLKEVQSMYHENDVFICHASEDKDKIARPLYGALRKVGLSVFLDEKSVKWGDSLVEVINKALYNAKVVIAVVTNNSVGKKWPERELHSVIAGSVEGDSKLLVLIDGDGKELLKEYYLMRDRLYKNWDSNPEELAEMVKEIVGKID